MNRPKNLLKLMQRRQREAVSDEVQEAQKRRRELVLIALVALTFLSFLFFEYRLVKISSSLPFVNSIFFFGLMNLNIILLGTLVWLIVRNIGKLFLERRSKMLGARLKTKLVASFLAFSIGPTLTLFLISALYINSSFDQWFSIRVRNTLQSSLEITRTYYRNADRTAMYFAKSIAERMGKKVSGRFESQLFAPPNLLRDVHTPAWVNRFLDEQRKNFALTALEFYSDPFLPKVSSIESRVNPKIPLPSRYPPVALEVLDQAFKGEEISSLVHLRKGDLIRALAPVIRSGGVPLGVIVVTTFIPVSLVNKVDEIANVFDDFEETNPLEFPIKTVYFVILLMITLLIIFVAIWIGLYLARQLTGPVEKLVQGVREVGAGNLDFSIKREGHDEISVLVDSFNRMTSDLKQNRESLAQANRGIEERRLQLEAVLANIGAGVVSLDRNQVITTFNPAAGKLLNRTPSSMLQTSLGDLSTSEELKPLHQLIERTFSMAKEDPQSMDLSQWSFAPDGTDESARQLAAVATPVQDDLGEWGVVVVIDDLSHVVKAQREVAWREVARRIAHEIKNPLTPIKLSAQRIKRRLGNLEGPDGALIRECTETIVQHTDELKEMVNEFSEFARLPQASPAPHSMDEVIDEVLNLYQSAHSDIAFEKLIPQKVPIFEFDRDQLKRVLINLVENAVAATLGRSIRRVTIQCRVDSSLHILRLLVQDNGVGMDETTQARIFEPYFSTKKEGTGLGLAIAKRIVTDHDGFVRVTSSASMGTEFVIELPMKQPSLESATDVKKPETK